MMRISNFIVSLKDPITKQDLELHIFDNQKDGILINPMSKCMYMIIDSVPVLLRNNIDPAFYETYKSEISKIINDKIIVDKQICEKHKHFSFSMEWQEFANHNMSQTWGIPTQSRLEQFYLETNQTPESIIGKYILDAGCGNGLLTIALAHQGANIIGLDYSDSVFGANKLSDLPNLLFVKADLMQIPIANQYFDIVISNGVIHHTKNTRYTFDQIAKTVKNGGTFYLWLYKKPISLYFSIFIKTTDFMRFVVNKLPANLQKFIVRYLTVIVYKIKIIRKRPMDYDQLLIDIYDTMTPSHPNTNIIITR